MLRGLSRSGLQRLRGRDRWEVLGFLRERVEQNAFLLGLVAADALDHESIAGSFIGQWRAGSLVGVACVGANLVLSEPCADEALIAFADFTERADHGVRVVVGPDALVDRFMGCLGREGGRIALERGAQALYRVDYTQLAQAGECPALRRAEVSEVEAVLRLDLAMVVEELGFDPFSVDLDAYRRGWIRRVRRGRAWVVTDSERGLIFKADLSTHGPDAAQLSGIYTAPAHRRRGVARRAIASLCDQLLEEIPVVTLFVASKNHAARALYEGLGFRQVGQVRSVWLR